MDDFSLPFSTMFTWRKASEDRFVAHALDFDLVCVAPTREQALERLSQTTKTYIEFGYSQGWTQFIKFPAPNEFWEAAWKASNKMEQLPPIEIDTKMIFPVAVQEDEAVSVA